MEEKADKKPILKIEENKDGGLSIRDGAYTIDKNGSLYNPAGGFPHVRLSDLFNHTNDVWHFSTHTLFIISTSKDDFYGDEADVAGDEADDEKENIAVTFSIGYLGPDHEWPFGIDRRTYYQLAEKCALDYQQNHAEDGDISGYISVDCAEKCINAHITSEFFDEAIEKGFDLIKKVLQPLDESEKSIAKKKADNSKESSDLE